MVNKDLAEVMEQGLRQILNDSLGDVAADLDGPVREIGQRMARAARRQGGEDLVQACKDQLQLLLMERQEAIELAAGDPVGMAIGIGFDALINGAVGGLGSLKR